MSFKLLCFATGLLTAVLAFEVAAQMSRKPTPTREPAGAMSKRPDSRLNSLPKITSRTEFDSIARVYHQGTPYSLPHVMFVIDRQAKNKVYFVNSQRFRFHKDFLLASLLVPRGANVFEPIYINKNRRFIVGTIAWQAPVEKFTWELWEGDLATSEMIATANAAINASFYERVSFKPNSSRQEDASADLQISRVLQSDLNKNQAYLALNTGTAVGRIHIIEKLDDTVEIGDNEIVVLKELPISLPPVRGIIVAKPSSPLSHVNVLAKGWNIPNVYIKDADRLFKSFDTFVMKLEANLTDYKFDRASVDEVREKFVSPDQQIPPVDLDKKTITALGAMRARNSIAFGAKAANLGEMMFRRIRGISIPDGFSVPFYWYDKFMKENGFDRIINDLMDNDDFVHNPRFRRQKLVEFRASIQDGVFDAALRAEIIQKWKTQLGSKPVFVRSSSNSEDLPNFSGAGLYSSVPNVIDEDKLIEAVKKVWASLWRFEAYEARVRNYVSQNDVYMSALIQVGIDMQKGGVMITKDPFDDRNKNAIYISAVCGHNSQVVNNKGIPEQTLFNPVNGSVAVLTRSQQESALSFDPAGDLRTTADECAGRNGRVLTDVQVRALGRAATAIKRAFGNRKEQDIEWGIYNGRIYVVQSRPYIDQ